MYWKDYIAERHLFLFDTASGPQATLRKLIKYNKGIKPKAAIYFVGLALLARDNAGIRGVRLGLSKVCDLRTWYRLAEGFKLLNKQTIRTTYHSWVKDINGQLERFKTHRH